MPRKDRAPTPPKRPQGPRPRTTQRDDDARRRLVLYVAAASGVVALVAVIAVLVSAGGGGGATGDPTAALKQAGCSYRVVQAVRPGIHINKINATPKWNTFPPSNGPHYPVPAVWGFYREPVALMQSVHNLEHGGIAIEWGSKVPASTVDRLERFYNESPDAMLGFPLPNLGNKIALVAWTQTPNEERGQGRVAECTTFDEKAFKAFRDDFRGKGPERFAVDQLTPGT